MVIFRNQNGFARKKKVLVTVLYMIVCPKFRTEIKDCVEEIINGVI